MCVFVESCADGDYWSQQFLNFFIDTLQFVNVYDRIYCATVSCHVYERVVCRRLEHYRITKVLDVKNGIREKYDRFSFERKAVRYERTPTQNCTSCITVIICSINWLNIPTGTPSDGRIVMKKTFWILPPNLLCLVLLCCNVASNYILLYSIYLRIVHLYTSLPMSLPYV